MTLIRLYPSNDDVAPAALRRNVPRRGEWVDPGNGLGKAIEDAANEEQRLALTDLLRSSLA